MSTTPDDFRQMTERLAKVRAELRAIEEQFNLTERKKLFNEMLSLERRLQESEAGK